MTAGEQGVYRISSGKLASVVTVGNANAKELSTVTATDATLSPLLNETGGGSFWLGRNQAEALPLPRIVMVRGGHVMHGADWLGLHKRDAYHVQGVRLFPMVALGASVGAAVGSQIAALLIPLFGVPAMLLVAAALLASCSALFWLVERRANHVVAEDPEQLGCHPVVGDRCLEVTEHPLDERNSGRHVEPMQRGLPPFYLPQVISHLLPRLVPTGDPKTFMFMIYVPRAERSFLDRALLTNRSRRSASATATRRPRSLSR